MYMPSYSKGSVILVRYPFSDLTSSKVRPAVVVSPAHPSQDTLIVPLTSKIDRLQPGEFVIQDWKNSGLNVPSAAKRGVFTIHHNLVIMKLGDLSAADSQRLNQSIREWLGL
jgi:mRNA interferase MazF